MFKLIIKIFVRDYHNTNDISVRNQYTFIAGILGIILNIILFIAKIIVGFYSNSIAIIGDSFNNLTDALSSIVATISSKITTQEPDEHHPFGHGRFEYIASFSISFLIMLVGFEILKSSIEHLLLNEVAVFNKFSLYVIFFGIIVKLFIYSYNMYLYRILDSVVNYTVAMDSLGDLLSSGLILFGIFMTRYTAIKFDSYIGIVIAFIILYAGYQLTKQMVFKLIGSAVSRSTIEDIKNIVLQYQDIQRIVSLQVHDYGQDNLFAYIHVEMDDNFSLQKSHNIIDRIEKDILKSLNINTVIHIDPITIIDNNLQS